MVDYDRINNTMGKLGYHLATHDCICVGVSGGSDSNIIVHMIATYFRKFLPKVHFVFSNTGLEYAATKRHLDYMEKRYDIHIERIEPERGNHVVSVVRRDGVPVLSKDFSNIMYYAEQGKPWALHRIERTKEESKFAMPPAVQEMARYLLEHNVRVSDHCCRLSKERPYTKYVKSIRADLKVSGERRCEGGQRASRHADCFEPKSKTRKIDKYMPLWFWNDETKQWYKEKENIRYSDCYEVWGMERTGCVGCPFNSQAGRDLKLIKQYEPNLYKACMNVFGESYRLMDQFCVHRHKILEDDKDEEKLAFD